MNKQIKILAAFLLLSCFTSQSNGDLIIVLNGDSSGRPAEAVGSGNLTDIVRAAADTWEDIFADDTSVSGFQLTVNFGWGNLSGSTLGLHQLVSEGLVNGIHREFEANLTFDNTSSPPWFMDATPLDHSEYTNYNEVTADLGGGSLVTERFFNGATGDANGAFDMYTVALHEIGHALGLSSANDAFVAEARTEGDNTVEVESPLGFAGSVIEIEPGSAHLENAFFSQSLMVPSIGSSTRRLAGDADILANAQISQFNAAKLSAVPEPGSLMILGGLFAFALRRRKV